MERVVEGSQQHRRWPLARWKPGDGLYTLLTLLCGVPTCSGILGYAAPYRTRTASPDPARPAMGLDFLTAQVFLVTGLREVPGMNPRVFELGSHAQRSSFQQPRRRAGVLFPDGRIEPAEGPPDAMGRYLVAGTPLVAQVKATVGDGKCKITEIRPVPVFMVTGSGAVNVHKDTLPIIVQCTKVAAHRSEVQEPEDEVDESASVV
jgi:hypothetical protein